MQNGIIFSLLFISILMTSCKRNATLLEVPCQDKVHLGFIDLSKEANASCVYEFMYQGEMVDSLGITCYQIFANTQLDNFLADSIFYRASNCLETESTNQYLYTTKERRNAISLVKAFGNSIAVSLNTKVFIHFEEEAGTLVNKGEYFQIQNGAFTHLDHSPPSSAYASIPITSNTMNQNEGHDHGYKYHPNITLNNRIHADIFEIPINYDFVESIYYSIATGIIGLKDDFGRTIVLKEG